MSTIPDPLRDPPDEKARYLRIEDIAYPEPGETETDERRFAAEGAALTEPLKPFPHSDFYVLITARKRVFDYLHFVTDTLIQTCFDAELKQEFDRAVARLWEIAVEEKNVFRAIYNGPAKDDPFVSSPEFAEFLQHTATHRR